jgi:hypothetical protein
MKPLLPPRPLLRIKPLLPPRPILAKSPLLSMRPFLPMKPFMAWAVTALLGCAAPASILLGYGFISSAVQAQGFKFSAEDESAKAKDAERQVNVSALLATPCRNQIKNQKIAVLFGESRDGIVQAKQASFSPHFDAVNSRLRALGLRTYTVAQIRQQVAQAEIDAFFRNDPDAALNASKRLAAQYMLRGLITINASRNLAVNVNQVNVSMAFTLTGANGKIISQANADEASYAGTDTSGMALTLINERADELVARLYSDYCQHAGAR